MEMSDDPISELGDIFAQLNDHTVDPNRPFTGQPHTDNGKRGMTEVKGIRFRDLADCVVKAMVISCPDVSEELRRRAEDGTLNWNDVYDLDFNEVDPIAIVQAVSCEVEKVMGIFPNIEPLKVNGDTNAD